MDYGPLVYKVDNPVKELSIEFSCVIHTRLLLNPTPRVLSYNNPMDIKSIDCKIHV